MNVYRVWINSDEENWQVEASNLSSAVRKAINADNLDRKENDWWYLDREVKETNVTIVVELFAENTYLKELEHDPQNQADK